ncbi:hypothetical protein [Acinetobacter shaoyimingii]|uniref:Uncharacterized protein n=1 Tax=Acinetobacter shaoyimingii TaxID=2715164 RepID=A0A6G8RUB9_9GAMM|nr:hypothetical protein [Acinetobacter shaoyimingii]QIO05532.1 hypothetical protein G8E00_05990 [Acinetobacter shaoyimingii]
MKENLKLNNQAWHETYLKMIGTTSTITLLISMSSVLIYLLLRQIHGHDLIQLMIISFSFISFFILIAQTLRSMYKIYHVPLILNCPQTYQKIIMFCSNFSLALIILASYFISLNQMLKTIY